MRILIVSTLKRKVAEKDTASRSRIIYEITLGMVKKGHDVTILGTGDTFVEGAKTLSVIPNSFVDLPKAENSFYAETSHLVRLAKKIEKIASDYDIVHNHTYPEFINLFAASSIKTPMVTTVHAQATEQFDDVLASFPDANLISISDAHRSGFKKTKFMDRIYNGIDTKTFSYKKKKEDYLLWIGRLSKAKDDKGEYMDPKGIKWAIRLAEETGEKLKLSGNVEDKAFFDNDVKSHLNEKIEWIGPVSAEQKLTREEVAGLMQGAKVFLMTINWNEPFGLVMAEAMSCGTPVIGFDRGAVREVIEEGETGFVVDPEDGIEGLKEALSMLDTINPETCRKHVEENFSIEKMVENYEKCYLDIINLKK